MPRTSFCVPLVRFHIVSSPGTPPATISIESEISALFIASGPLKVDHAIFTSFRPERGGMLLEKLFMLHHVELQIAHRELAGDANFLCARGAGKQRSRSNREESRKKFVA